MLLGLKMVVSLAVFRWSGRCNKTFIACKLEIHIDVFIFRVGGLGIYQEIPVFAPKIWYLPRGGCDYQRGG